MNIPDRYISGGHVRDVNNYICVAITLVGIGQEIATSLGPGKRYDTYNTPNTVEIYTDR